MSDELLAFSAQIYKVGVIRFVDVPVRVSKSLGSGKARIPVKGTANGLSLQTTLTPSGGGRHRLAIHGEIYKKLRIDSGDSLRIAIAVDKGSREPKLPPALKVALEYSPSAAKAFRAMTTALRRQIVRYLSSAKSQDTVERRVARFISRLERGAHSPGGKRRNAKPPKSFSDPEFLE